MHKFCGATMFFASTERTDSGFEYNYLFCAYSGWFVDLRCSQNQFGLEVFSLCFFFVSWIIYISVSICNAVLILFLGAFKCHLRGHCGMLNGVKVWGRWWWRFRLAQAGSGHIISTVNNCVMPTELVSKISFRGAWCNKMHWSNQAIWRNIEHRLDSCDVEKTIASD